MLKTRSDENKVVSSGMAVKGILLLNNSMEEQIYVDFAIKGYMGSFSLNFVCLRMLDWRLQRWGSVLIYSQARFDCLELFGTVFSEASSNKSGLIFRLCQMQNRDHLSYLLKIGLVIAPNTVVPFSSGTQTHLVLYPGCIIVNEAACLSLVRQYMYIRNQCATSDGWY